ncbi:uncharacterized protein LOC141691209 [Apium graveolens]|uniref:uncharacterized protein LOC141691209 n=1 Tax=Apium graveolens TaxID=4045 RepID=UPI003D7A893B
MPESLVPPSKRTTKDKEFMKAKKLLIKEKLIQMKDELDRYRQRTNTQIIVTVPITTVAFTAGFTMPGGLHQDGELKGMVILLKKKAFIAFMVCDALALLLSTSSLFLYFIASMYEDPHSVSKLNDASTVLNIVSVIAMMLTFMAGTYVVVSHSRALAFTVIAISCFFFLLVVIEGRWGYLTSYLIAARRKNKEIYSGFDAIFDITDQNYDDVLSLSVRKHNPDAVTTILAEDPAYKSAEKLETGLTYKINQIIIKSYEASKNIGHADQTALHTAIIKRDEESVFRLLRQDDEIVSKADSEYWTPLHYAAYYDFYSILEATHIGYKPQEYLSANQIWWVPTPLHVAAKEGYTCTLIKLMELLPADLYVAADSITHQNILHLAVLSSKKEMIVHVIKKCPEEHIDKMLNQQDVNGDTPLHLLIRDGCFVPELIKHKEIDRMVKNGQYWTSFDMLYFKDQIIADQVKIKKALDDFQADQHPKIIWQYFRFWRGSMEKKSKMLESLVPPSKRTTKDNEFKKAKKLLMKENLIQMKDELDRYRQRTNTQIIVTALITTVTFTVGFTMPGGYNQDGDLKGMVILSEKKSFIAFMVSDALALLLSTSSLFLYFIASMYEDPRSVSKLNDASTVLNIVSVIAMMLTFITGTYVVLSHSRALAYTVIVISCFFFLLVVIGLLIKWRYDRKQEMMHEV